jgi:predicted Zn finger-like uncharacterized protein
MRLPEGMRKHGFRKWYERELIQSHLHLVLTLGCVIGLLGAVEVFSIKAPLSVVLGNVIAVLLCAGIGLWALRRYLYLLLHAEETANQAVCPSCEAYGRFTLVAEDSAERRITVRCRGCGHQWPISH